MSLMMMIQGKMILLVRSDKQLPPADVYLCMSLAVVNPLSWKLQPFPAQHFSYIQIEEVAIQDGLHNSSHDGDEIIVRLGHVTIHPVEDVEGAVGSQRKQVMRRDRLRLASLAHHEQLRQDCHRFQVDAECPQNFQQCKVVINQQSQDHRGRQQQLDTERIVIMIVRGFKLHIDEITRSVRCPDKHHLH